MVGWLSPALLHPIFQQMVRILLTEFELVINEFFILLKTLFAWSR